MLTLTTKTLHAVEKTAQLLRDGGVAAIPTETVYGLVALWEDATAKEKIYALKHRPQEKRLQMLAHSVESAYQAGLLPNESLSKLEKRFWPGPLTVVAPSSEGDTIGLRIPDHPFVLALLKELNAPLAATSANLSGQAPGLTAQEAIAHLDGEPEILIDGGKVTITGGLASTVVSILPPGPTLLRAGSISLQEIQECLG